MLSVESGPFSHVTVYFSPDDICRPSVLIVHVFTAKLDVAEQFCLRKVAEI